MVLGCPPGHENWLGIDVLKKIRHSGRLRNAGKKKIQASRNITGIYTLGFQAFSDPATWNSKLKTLFDIITGDRRRQIAVKKGPPLEEERGLFRKTTNGR
jgi:hypothetical protein